MAASSSARTADQSARSTCSGCAAATASIESACPTRQDGAAGLTADVIERLFRPFEQAEQGAEGGLGLGLASARGIVELHGGTLTAASRGPGHGSRFVVDLPNQPIPPRPPEFETATARTGVREQPAAAKERILLVEDNPATARALSIALRAEGHVVTVASTVAEALRVDLATSQGDRPQRLRDRA